MLRQDPHAKRRSVVDQRRKHVAAPQFKEQQYPHRLNFYSDPPTADITLEQFEQWAIDRLKVLAELEACSFRNRSPQETVLHMKPVLDKYLLLDSNSSGSARLFAQRQKDHYGHFILRLAFSSTADLRRRFARLETMLFKMRLGNDDISERAAFVAGLDFDWWDPVSEDEKRQYAAELAAVTAAMGRWTGSGGAGSGGGGGGGGEDEAWFKVDWTRVLELVETRRVFVKAGKAYVPAREQSTMVVAEFASRLERQLELTARALPRLDEDDRLTPILNHLSKNFITPDAAYTGGDSAPVGAEMTAANVQNLSQHFPACMSHLQRTLRRDAHLKHYGRLQYTLFLKGIGLNLEECLIFWRKSFHKFTDDEFNKEYRYNVRHAYGDVGGDSNRRGGGYSSFSCQKILTEHLPGPGDSHGCPYRHFDPENLASLVQAMGVDDDDLIKAVMNDKKHQKYHIACNRVFEHLHKTEIKKAKDESAMTAAQLDTIVHPNEYFKRSYVLKNLGKDGDVKMEE